VQCPIKPNNRNLLTPLYQGTLPPPQPEEGQAEQTPRKKMPNRAELCATTHSPTHQARMLPITPSRKRKITNSDEKLLQDTPPPNPPTPQPKFEKRTQPRKPKIWREFSPHNGTFKLIEVRDYGITPSSRKKKIKSTTNPREKSASMNTLSTLALQPIPMPTPEPENTKLPSPKTNPNLFVHKQETHSVPTPMPAHTQPGTTPPTENALEALQTNPPLPTLAPSRAVPNPMKKTLPTSKPSHNPFGQVRENTKLPAHRPAHSPPVPTPQPLPTPKPTLTTPNNLSTPRRKFLAARKKFETVNLHEQVQPTSTTRRLQHEHLQQFTNPKPEPQLKAKPSHDELGRDEPGLVHHHDHQVVKLQDQVQVRDIDQTPKKKIKLENREGCGGITTLIEKWGGGKSDLQNSARIQENFNQTESKFRK
jgi:hypothetical protein